MTVKELAVVNIVSNSTANRKNSERKILRRLRKKMGFCSYQKSVWSLEVGTGSGFVEDSRPGDPERVQHPRKDSAAATRSPFSRCRVTELILYATPTYM